MMRLRLAQTLPGSRAQLEMSPEYSVASLFNPTPEGAVDSAVLAMLSPATTSSSPESESKLLDWSILLIRRNLYPGVHSGQIALPGGRSEETDADFWATAQREAWEEVGVLPDQLCLAGRLTSLYVPGSNFVIHPFVATVSSDFLARADEREVADFKRVPLRIFDPARAARMNFLWSDGRERPAPAWQYEDYTVWGATAMILAELYRAIVGGILAFELN
ncbi:MAG: CoA pyrophosphatase [Deltaproteobacteria bacterium]|nr:CoA pyrophosphatase [Deltaproteobacteria bacterium]